MCKYLVNHKNAKIECFRYFDNVHIPHTDKNTSETESLEQIFYQLLGWHENHVLGGADATGLNIPADFRCFIHETA